MSPFDLSLAFSLGLEDSPLVRSFLEPVASEVLKAFLFKGSPLTYADFHILEFCPAS